VKPTNDEERWAAVVARDAAADGLFYYSVSTTGVYCRPSCPSRRALRQHVSFHLVREHAEQAGFRPCKRCRPDQPSLAQRQAKKISEICELIATADTSPKLEDLAKAADMSVYHFHRVFKSITGVTPKAYGDAHRSKRVRTELAQSNTVTDAIYGAGFMSNGRFYATSKQVLGMTPTSFRAGGANVAIWFAVGQCSLGAILVAATDVGICAISLGDDPEKLVRNLQDQFPSAQFVGGDRNFERLVAKVVGFVEAPAIGLELPLDIRGTAFQRRVWQALREIPPGETASYAEIAQRIGSPDAVRAVARACATNSIAVAIPCHRVVRRDGSLSGYRWGVERKRSLLDKEGATVGA
jgi:AraC family transcriptional regulator of adaptative response/methylated-DNA-[protein]-cysteine methyltransferase